MKTFPGSDEVWGFLPYPNPHPLLRAQPQPVKLLSCKVALASQQHGVPSFAWQSSGLLCFGVAMNKVHGELAPLYTLSFAVYVSHKWSESNKKAYCFFSGWLVRSCFVLDSNKIANNTVCEPVYIYVCVCVCIYIYTHIINMSGKMDYLINHFWTIGSLEKTYISFHTVPPSPIHIDKIVNQRKEKEMKPW